MPAAANDRSFFQNQPFNATDNDDANHPLLWCWSEAHSRRWVIAELPPELTRQEPEQQQQGLFYNLSLLR